MVHLSDQILLIGKSLSPPSPHLYPNLHHPSPSSPPPHPRIASLPSPPSRRPAAPHPLRQICARRPSPLLPAGGRRLPVLCARSARGDPASSSPPAAVAPRSGGRRRRGRRRRGRGTGRSLLAADGSPSSTRQIRTRQPSLLLPTGGRGPSSPPSVAGPTPST